MNRTTRLLWSCLLAIVALSSAPLQAQTTPVIDGRIDPAEWQGAQHVEDFRLVEPLTRESSPYPTEAWILPTADGLAIGFRNVQPPEVQRTRERSPRDQGTPVDRVAVTIDYEGGGRSALAFTVTLADSILDGTVVNENQYSTDWNGDWAHAVSEDEQAWYAELLLPWHLAPMPAAIDGKRQLGISLSRVIGDRGQRVSWPAIAITESRYISQLEQISVAAFSQSLLAITPYSVLLTDLKNNRTEFNAGADLFWKPNNRFQLSATLNPDFGQVESDQLVVNFGAVESFFSDRRPFFTENQSLFDVPFGISNSRLLYTRRVGASADDGSGAADVNAAIKLNGNAGPWQYGVFAADEDGEAGRQFLASRAVGDFGEHDVGLMVTEVDRPFLERDASSFALDHQWARGDQISIRSTLVGSSIDQSGETADDFGWQTRLDQRFTERFRQQIYFLHMGEELELNDFGYLDRNDLNYLRYEIGDRRTGFSADSRYTSVDHRYATSTRRNNDGLHLFSAVAWYRQALLKDGGTEYNEITLVGSNNDDRILRGNGIARVPERLITYYERTRPRKGNWALAGSIATRSEGIDGISGSAIELSVFPTWYLNDDLNISPFVQLRYSPDWLLWRGENRLATFKARQLIFNTDFNWIISPHSELRLKIETIALAARAVQSYRAGPDRIVRPSDEVTADFSLSNLGFQIRYRYELAPLSDLFLVYSRGGLDFANDRDSVSNLFGDAFDLRDDEQLLVKLSYRFD